MYNIWWLVTKKKEANQVTVKLSSFLQMEKNLEMNIIIYALAHPVDFLLKVPKYYIMVFFF